MQKLKLSPQSIQILNDLLDVKKACLIPFQWDKFYTYHRRQFVAREITCEFPGPMILGGWWGNSNLDKNLRFLEQIKIISENGLLSDCMKRLEVLPSESWYPEINMIRSHHIMKQNHPHWPYFSQFLN
jgi:hypothetical protein